MRLETTLFPLLIAVLAGCAGRAPSPMALAPCASDARGELPERPPPERMHAVQDSLRALGKEPDRETVFTPYDVKPEIATSRGTLARLLEQSYPAALKEAGIGGTAVVWTLVDAEGAVRATEISRSARHLAIDQAAATVLQQTRFSPAVRQGCRTAVWIQLPVTFRVAGRPTS